MKAPDKIYVCIPKRLNLSTFKEDTKYVGMAYTDRGNLTSPQIEEYIRKDVLLEWAKGHQEGERQGSYIWSCFQIFIDKLNSL